MILKKSNLEDYRNYLLRLQDNKCAVCKCDFSAGYFNYKQKKVLPRHIPCLDHDHTTGVVRGVLCRGCNSLEGKVVNTVQRWHTLIDGKDKKKLASVLYGLAHYVVVHEEDRTNRIHPTFKTERQKKDVRNKKARDKRKSNT